MLKVGSFKFSDADGINEFLSKYSLASGMHIMVSNGEVLIPVEDGAPKTAAVQICELKEEQNTLREQRDIIVHSEEVNAGQIADIENRVNVARAELDAATSAPVRERSQKKLNEAEEALDQVKVQSLKNKHEIARIDLNIGLTDEKIAELSK